MAEEQEVILSIDIDTSKLTAQMAATLNDLEGLKKKQAEYNRILKDTGKLSEDEAAVLASVQSQIKAKKAELSSLNATYAQSSKVMNGYGDSLNEMRRKLSDMQRAYDGLSQEMREGEGGKAFLAQIKAQHDAVLGLEEDTGRAQRNVGNYQSAVSSLIPGLDKLNGILGKAGTSFTELASNVGGASKSVISSLKGIGKMFITPPIAIITVIVGGIIVAFQKLQEAFKKSDDAGTALASGLAILKPVGTAIGKVFDALANIIGNFVEGVGKAVTAVAGFIEGLAGVEDGYTAAADAAVELVKQQDNLEEAERQFTVNSAKRNKEISELRNKAKEALDPKDAKKYLEQANKLAEKNLAEEKRIAKEKLDILENTARQENDTSDETKNKIAAARAAMYNAEKAYYDGVRELQEQARSADKKIQEAEKKREEEAKKLAEERLKRRQELAAKEKDIATKLQEALFNAVEDEGMRELLLINLQYDREVQALKDELKKKKDLTKKAQQDLLELIRVTEEERARVIAEARAKQLEEYVNAQKTQMDAETAHSKRVLGLRLRLAEEGSEEEREARLALAQLEFDQALEAEGLYEDERVLMKQEFERKLFEIEEDYRKKTEEAEEESLDQRINRQAKLAAEYQSLMGNMLGTASQAFSALSDLYANDAEESESARKKQRGLALTSIILNEAQVLASTATSIAAAVAAASEAAVFTGPAAPIAIISFIASMTSAVLAAVAGTASTISQAKQLVSESEGDNYATGGIVGGSSYTGDKVRANVNSGEMILNRGQQTRLFNIANGAGGTAFDYSALASAMAAAVAAQPAPVLGLKEFTTFSKKTTIIKENARL